MIKSKKILAVMGMAFALSALSACSPEPVPDDVREISEEEKKGIINAQTMPEKPVEVTPSMGPGLADKAPEKATEPIDNGKIIMVPSVAEVSVVPNEKVKLYAGQLTPGQSYPAVIFYSVGSVEKTIDLGTHKVNPEGELSADVVVPANIVPGKYVISYNVDGSLYTAQIKVG